MRVFLIFILLGPFIGGAVLAVCAFPFIALTVGVDSAMSMGLLFILFSPVLGVVPAAISITLIRYFKGERHGRALNFYAAKIGFLTTFLLALLVTSVSIGSDANWAIPLSFDIALLTDTLAVLAYCAAFGLLGLVPGYVCAKVGYASEVLPCRALGKTTPAGLIA